MCDGEARLHQGGCEAVAGCHPLKAGGRQAGGARGASAATALWLWLANFSSHEGGGRSCGLAGRGAAARANWSRCHLIPLTLPITRAIAIKARRPPPADPCPCPHTGVCHGRHAPLVAHRGRGPRAGRLRQRRRRQWRHHAPPAGCVGGLGGGPQGKLWRATNGEGWGAGGGPGVHGLMSRDCWKGQETRGPGAGWGSFQLLLFAATCMPPTAPPPAARSPSPFPLPAPHAPLHHAHAYMCHAWVPFMAKRTGCCSPQAEAAKTLSRALLVRCTPAPVLLPLCSRLHARAVL